jgi:hypothetical protein
MEGPRIPVIKSLAKEAIVKFDKDYKEYVRDCELSNRRKVTTNRVAVRKICECVDSNLWDMIAPPLEQVQEDSDGEAPQNHNEKFIVYLDSLIHFKT